MKKTLVSVLRVVTDHSRLMRRSDVVVEVSSSNGSTLVTFDAVDVEVHVSLSGAERIALIEALGGKAS